MRYSVRCNLNLPWTFCSRALSALARCNGRCIGRESDAFYFFENAPKMNFAERKSNGGSGCPSRSTAQASVGIQGRKKNRAANASRATRRWGRRSACDRRPSGSASALSRQQTQAGLSSGQPSWVLTAGAVRHGAFSLPPSSGRARRCGGDDDRCLGTARHTPRRRHPQPSSRACARNSPRTHRLFSERTPVAWPLIQPGSHHMLTRRRVDHSGIAEEF